MRDQCGAIFQQAKVELEECGLLKEEEEPIKVEAQQNPPIEEAVASDIDKELEALQQAPSASDVIPKLEALLAKSQSLKHGLARAKRVKLVRNEINRVKKLLASAESSQSDVDADGNESKTSQSTGTSPGGVNRRTAVLFTRKAQAALKKSEDEKEDKPEGIPPATKQ